MAQSPQMSDERNEAVAYVGMDSISGEAKKFIELEDKKNQEQQLSDG